MAIGKEKKLQDDLANHINKKRLYLIPTAGELIYENRFVSGKLRSKDFFGFRLYGLALGR